MDFMGFFTKKSSKDTAKERLQLILIHDRATVSPELLDNIKEEIMSVISKYVEIDKDELEITMTTSDEEEGNSPALVANIPIKKMLKRR
ncbi:cell division topological specificity factor MinE [Clostridium sp. MSJ-11]|uniref:Cell division topological specificity factor n=1 Tax=Clostridium mobile TaxID=2841512 RepID=A0ABS6EFS4_9CLOT|nr:cell division topological specificity factor MinE [Clostridium mobile]MBU5483566.1 cell division topological specificity factor MinE [Clostridium mobile]